MELNLNSPLYRGAQELSNFGGSLLPSSFRGPKAEYLAGRSTAWLGVCLMNSPVYDVSGPDAAEFLNSVAVNRDFAKLAPGASRHVVLCNDRGQMLADGLTVPIEHGVFRTYWLAPVLQFLLEKSPLDVTGSYVMDEYFLQLDGPKSLEILEEATQTDLHDLRFGRNTKIRLAGTDATVHRLGMSGALAYELHGATADLETAYGHLRDVLERFGGLPQGASNYHTINHTPGGYPNQYQHFMYPYLSSGADLADFYSSLPFVLGMAATGSASDDDENFYRTPFDIGWGSVVNFDHEFPGKAALQAAAAHPPRKTVTLEWNADDVGEVFASQFRGQGATVYDPIEFPQAPNSVDKPVVLVRGDYVQKEGRTIGVSTGKTIAYWEQRMISLACVDTDSVQDGDEVVILWGQPGAPQKKIRARVAQFPYYNGEFRNESFDTSSIPRREALIGS